MNIWEYISDYRFEVFNHYWWKDFWYNQVSSRIRPRNKWLTKKIPRTWLDKDNILEIAVLESLKHYVEGEEALGKDMCHFASSQADPSYPEWQKEFDREVKVHYELTTQTLAALQKELDIEWNKVSDDPMGNLNDVTKNDYERRYGKIDRLEQEIYDLQTKIMLWVINNRNKLWT